MDTLSQVNIPDDAKMDDLTLEEICASPSPLVKTPGSSSKAPSLNVTKLKEEANKAPVTLVGIQVFYQHSPEETSFRLWDGPSSK